jgi:putative protease
MVPRIELLAPAKDLDCGLAAIDSGADAVYLGASRFGARVNAGNPLHDISALVEHAHRFWARVYVTVNTLLYDDELPEAVHLIHQLYEMGVDAIIIQDVGLLECDLPPVALFASTQMHNRTPERVAFLEQIGIRRVILPRELSLAEIRAIRARTTIELESFIHGALCVGYSGQCYLSYAIGGRSGNRGECAQPCRRLYNLVDADGKPLVRDRYLLSLRDLNLTDSLGELLDAGITSFKIEGRLKDRAYVTNVVSWYCRRLDQVLAVRGWARSSSGRSTVDFEPDVSKTFNRGFTTHFLHGRKEPPGAIDSPKMVGEYIGTVTAVQGSTVLVDTGVGLHSGDGLCWFDARGRLCGTVVNAARAIAQGPGGMSVTLQKTDGIHQGLEIYRNHDHAFLRRVERGRPARRIAVWMRLTRCSAGLMLQVGDEDGNCAAAKLAAEPEYAHKPDRAETTARAQLSKTGNTPYLCAGVDLEWDQAYFLPVAALNSLRRDALERLGAARDAHRPVMRGRIQRNRVPYPETALTFHGNVLNQRSADFYRRHGVQEIVPAAESGHDMAGEVVMRARYCIKHQLGLCDGTPRPGDLREPLYLVDAEGHRYRLRFQCVDCEMEVIF